MTSISSLKGSESYHPGSFYHRMRDVFPPGFDSPSNKSNRTHYTLAPDQLHRTLTSSYEPRKHVESIVVKSAWYGRQSKLAKQEFVLIQVEDTAIPELINFMVLGRSTSTPSSVLSGLIPHSRIRFHGEMARDTFKIAYDGDQGQLLRECNLEPYSYLERLDFRSAEPLLLYQLSTLVNIISEQYPQYRFADINGSRFAGLIWECMRQIRTGVVHGYISQTQKKRGRIGWIRQAPDAAEVSGICQTFRLDILALEEEFAKQKNMRADLSICENPFADGVH